MCLYMFFEFIIDEFIPLNYVDIVEKMFMT